MGVYQSIYLGPYIGAPAQNKTVDVLVKRCEKTSSHYIKESDNFCSTCGSPIVNKTESKQRIWSASRALDKDYQDTLVLRGNEILTPNRLLEGLNINVNSERNGVYDLPSDEIKARDIELMKEQYKKEIEFLQSENFEVTFHYGLIIDFS